MSYSDLEKNDVSSSIYYVKDLEHNNNVLSLHSEYLKYNNRKYFYVNVEKWGWSHKKHLKTNFFFLKIQQKCGFVFKRTKKIKIVFSISSNEQARKISSDLYSRCLEFAEAM